VIQIVRMIDITFKLKHFEICSTLFPRDKLEMFSESPNFTVERHIREISVSKIEIAFRQTSG